MARMRSLISQSPAILISVLALAFSLGGGAAYAAMKASTGVSWHTLTLLNGWKPSGAQVNGKPRIAISNGIVYLSGAIQGGSVGAPFAVLPAAYRPKHILRIADYVAYDSGHVFVYPNGQITAEDSGSGGTHAAVFTELSGVSYPKNS